MLAQPIQAAAGALQPVLGMFQSPVQAAQGLTGLPQSLLGSVGGRAGSALAAEPEIPVGLLGAVGAGGGAAGIGTGGGAGAGSIGAASVGAEGRVPMLVDELGDLIVHGVAMRPSSPSGVGRIKGVPVLLLPGNPVSCLVAYDFFAGPVIRRLGGLPEGWPYLSIRLPLGKRIVSQIGRTDYARVSITDGLVEPLAISGASVLSSVTRASGFVIVPEGLEGHAQGSEVEVHLYGDQVAR